MLLEDPPRINSRWVRVVLIACVCAAIVTLTWFLALQQAELVQLQAAMAVPTQMTLTIADSPAHATCERIDNNSGSPLLIRLRTQNPGDKPVAVKIAAHGSNDVCVDYGRALAGG